MIYSAKAAKMKTAYFVDEDSSKQYDPLNEAYINLCAAVIKQAFAEVEAEYKERHNYRRDYGIVDDEYRRMVKGGDGKIMGIQRFFLSPRFEDFNLDMDGRDIFDAGLERIERKYCAVDDPHDLVFIHERKEYRFLTLRMARQTIGCGGDRLIRFILGEIKEVNGWQMRNDSRPKLKPGWKPRESTLMENRFKIWR